MTSNEDYDQMVKTFYTKVLRYATKLTHNTQDAEELTQTTFLRAFKARDRRIIGRSPISWLFRITYNCFLDMLSTKKRSPITVSIEVLTNDNLQFDPADPALNPESEFFSSRLSEPMKKTMASLTESQRNLMVLAHFRELSHDEISKVIGCGASTVKTRIHRVHKTIKKQLTLEGLESASACRRSAR